MKENWKYKNFEDCLENVKYTNKIQTSDYLNNGSFPIISQEDDLISGYWNNIDDVFKIKKPIVIFGDHTRVLKYVDFDFVLGADGVKILQPVNEISAKFLFYSLVWQKIPSLGYSRHYKLLKELSIPVPPLPVQQQIVAELDLLSDIIEKQKQQIAELDKLAQATFYDMFGDPVTNEKGWEVKKLGEVAIEKLSYGSGASAIDYDGKLRYVRITDICDSGELNDDFKSPSSYDERYLLNDGDILFARSGATVGKTYCHNSKNGQCIYAGYLIRMIPDRRLVLPEYIFQYTKSEFYNSFIRKSQNAVAQPNINAKQYSDLTVLLPPLPLQQSFASKIEAIERQKELISNSIKESRKLFDSRMEYWFG